MWYLFPCLEAWRPGLEASVSKQLDWLRIAAHVLQGALQAWEVSPWFTQMGLGMAGNGWEWLENPQLLYETIGCSIAGRRLATCWWCWLVSQCDTQKKLCNPYKTHSLLKKHWSELGTGEVMDEVRYRSHGLPYPLYRGFCAAQSIHLSSHRWQACPVVPWQN